MRCAALLGVVVLAACRCQPGPVDPVELGIRVEPRSLDFGRVLEGATATRALTLAAETRAAVTVRLSTDQPFAAPRVAEVPGGADTTIEVTFRARDGVSEGVLRLTVGDKTAEVPLVGTGVRPPVCLPTKECVVSEYSLELDACVETPAPDDAPCDPKSLCLEQGRCRQGACLGVARRCDDNDLCTNDACSMEVGCVHTPVTCPTPTVACQVATCAPTTGCGEAPAADSTPCGSADCVSLHVCAGGACTAIETPEGFPCAPPIACLPEGTCQNDVCARTFVGQWEADWSAPLAVEPTGDLASAGSQLFVSVCGVPVDGGAPEALDGGDEDGGVDGGDDGGGVDAGDVDGGDGADAGPALSCALASYTTTGFERFTRPYEDRAPREVWAVGPAGVVLRADGGLEVRARSTGELREALEVPVARRQLVITDDGLVAVLADGGLVAFADADGGTRALAAVGPGASLAGGAALFAWDADAGLLTRVALLADGGVDTEAFSVASGEGVLTEGAAVLVGAGTRLSPESDGGWRAVVLDWADAGALAVLEEETLAARDAVDVFYQRCDAGLACPELSRETWLRVFDPTSGQARWDVQVLPGGVETRLVATTLLDEQPGAVATVVRADFDAGAQAFLQVFSEGQRRLLCRLPEASGAVLSAHFATSALVVTARRPDGGVVLEAYPLNALPVSSGGWPRPHGLDGARLAR